MKRRSGLLVSVLTTLTIAGAMQAGTHPSAGSHDGVTRYKWSRLLSTLGVELKGEVEFTADDRAIAAISRGGRLELFERDGLTTRKLTIENGASGLEYTYRRGGSVRPFDEAGRKWFGELLPRVIRETGIGATARVARILGESGTDGVFDEIERIDGSRAARIYCSELLAQGDLDRGGLKRLADAAAAGIASSGELAGFLTEAAEEYLVRGAAADYFAGTRTIASSGDHARVLLHVLDRELADDAIELVGLLQSAREISSSGDKARVVSAAAGNWVEDNAVRRAFFDAADSIASSGDHARALIALLGRPSLSPATVAGAFRSTRGISSSGDKARVLLDGARRVEGDRDVRREYLAAAGAVSSSADRARVLERLIETASLDEAGMVDLLRAARSISSSGDKARVLVSAARHLDGDKAVDAFLSTAETIASSSDRTRALSALIR